MPPTDSTLRNSIVSFNLRTTSLSDTTMPRITTSIGIKNLGCWLYPATILPIWQPAKPVDSQNIVYLAPSLLFHPSLAVHLDAVLLVWYVDLLDPLPKLNGKVVFGLRTFRYQGLYPVVSKVKVYPCCFGRSHSIYLECCLHLLCFDNLHGKSFLCECEQTLSHEDADSKGRNFWR